MFALFLTLTAVAAPIPIYGTLQTSSAPLTGPHVVTATLRTNNEVAWTDTQTLSLQEGRFAFAADVPKGRSTLTVSVDGGPESEAIPLPGGRRSVGEVEVTVPPAPPRPSPAAPVVAWVNGHPITTLQFVPIAQRRVPKNGETLSLAERRDTLDSLIAEELFYQEAEALGLAQDPKVKKLMANTLVRQVMAEDARTHDITDEDLRAYFDSHFEDFVTPEKRQIKWIRLKSTSRSADENQRLADYLHTQLKEDPSRFLDLARQYDESPYSRRGGDLGFISLEGKPGIPDAVVRAAFELQMDQVSDVFQLDGDLVLLLVVKKRYRLEPTYPQMKSSVLRTVKIERAAVVQEELVAALRAKSVVSIDDETLLAADVTRGGSSHNGSRAPQADPSEEEAREEEPTP